MCEDVKQLYGDGAKQQHGPKPRGSELVRDACNFLSDFRELGCDVVSNVRNWVAEVFRTSANWVATVLRTSVNWVTTSLLRTSSLSRSSPYFASIVLRSS